MKNSYEDIEQFYFDYCKVRKLNKEQAEIQTWGKEPMIEFAEQVVARWKELPIKTQNPTSSSA